MFRKTHYIALLLMALLVVLVLRLPSQTAGKLKLVISSLYLPFFGLAGSAHDLSVKTGNTLLPKSELLRQNQQLRRENQELRIQIQQHEATLLENARLRQQVAWKQQCRWKLKLARVVGRDPANWWKSIQIDLGNRDGIRTNLPVLISDGREANLVGKVQNVGETRSQVVLLGDPNLRVAGKIQDTGETGIIQSPSSGRLEQNMVELGFLSGASSIRPGQKVVTWGEGGVFPPDILIGQVVDSRTRDHGLSTEARVRVSAKLNSLQEVWVMLP